METIIISHGLECEIGHFHLKFTFSSQKWGLRDSLEIVSFSNVFILWRNVFFALWRQKSHVTWDAWILHRYITSYMCLWYMCNHVRQLKSNQLCLRFPYLSLTDIWFLPKHFYFGENQPLMLNIWKFENCIYRLINNCILRGFTFTMRVIFSWDV